MDEGLKIKLYALTLDCKAPQELAKFYAALLGWETPYQDADFAVISPPGKAQGEYPGVMFQRNPDFVPPVWPETPGEQQQMAHIDVAVNDLNKAEQHAVACGARAADKQFSPDWKVMIDPEGHPFCLCPIKDVFSGE